MKPHPSSIIWHEDLMSLENIQIVVGRGGFYLGTISSCFRCVLWMNHIATKSILHDMSLMFWLKLGHNSRYFEAIKVSKPDFHVKCSKIKSSIQIFRKFCLLGKTVAGSCKSSRLTIWMNYHLKYASSWSLHQFFKFKSNDTKTTSKDTLFFLLFTLDKYFPTRIWDEK